MNFVSVVDQHDCHLEVKLGNWTLPAGVWCLAVYAFAIALHLWQVFIKNLSRTQSGHQIVKLSPVVLSVLFGFSSLPFFLPLLFELKDIKKEDIIFSSKWVKN